MPFTLEERYRGLQDEARAVAAEIEPIAAEVDALSSVHPELLRVLRGSELGELVVPAADGGRFEQVDPLAVCVVHEALMEVSGNSTRPSPCRASAASRSPSPAARSSARVGSPGSPAANIWRRSR